MCAPDVNVTVETSFRISATTGRVVLTERLFSDANEERSHTVIALIPLLATVQTGTHVPSRTPSAFCLGQQRTAPSA